MTTPTAPPPAPQQPTTTGTAAAQPGPLAPVQPARPLASSASYHAPEGTGSKADGKPQAAPGGSVTKALLLALAERIRQRPVTQQKRWEAKKARALGHQVKEARTVNETVAPARKDATPKGGKDGKPGPGGKQQPGARQAISNAGTKPQPKPVRKDSERSGSPRNDSRKALEPSRKPDTGRKVQDRKSLAQQSGDRKASRKDSGPVPDVRKPVRKAPEGPRKTPEKPRPEVRNDRKPVRNQPGKPDAVRKQEAPVRNDRKPQPEAPRKDSASVRKSPEPVRKPPEKVPPQRPVDRKEPEARKGPEPGPIRPVRKTPEAPRKPEQQATPEPKKRAPEPVWKKPPEKPVAQPKGPSPVAPVQPARPAPQPVKPPEPKPVQQVPPKPEQPPVKKEDKVTTAPEKTDVQPVQVKGANAWGVQLGDGAARNSLSRGEVRTMKQLERYLEASVTQMQQAAEQAKVIRDKAVEEATEAKNLAEKTRSVKGGERLLPKLNRLAEQADNRAKKAEGIHKGTLRAAERSKALLVNLKQRDGLIYEAVVNSPETEPAEMAFYQDRS
jgi:hypothetical protein